MAHVFIVNKITFKYHLEYMFAGTGASQVPTDFIFDASIKLNTQDEKRSVGMITDVSRIKKGDKILFFVTGISKLYGIFEAESEFFLDPNDSNNFLVDKLEKILTYRILIKPFKVYKNGISEYDCLDSLEGVKYPDEICWSLIYRKLGGNRGCTMITNQEYEIIENKLSKNNSLINNGENYSFDTDNDTIISSNTLHKYTGRKIDIEKNLRENMIDRYKNKKAFEHYIQYFCVLMLKSSNYKKLLLSESPVTWIGNEVMCSFGEHRIDAFAIQETSNNVEITLIEMKDEKIQDYIIYQIESYLRWLKDYIIPGYLRKGKQIVINPVILSDGIPNARNSTKEKLNILEDTVKSQDWNKYSTNNVTVKKTRIIHFNDKDGNLIF